MKNMRSETLIWVIISLVVLFFVISRLGYGSYGGMVGMMYGNYGNGMMLFGWLYGILILLALVLFIAWLVKQLQKK